MYRLHNTSVHEAHLSEQSVCMRHPTICPWLPMRRRSIMYLSLLQIVDWYLCCVLGQCRLQVCRRGVCVHQSRHSLCSMCSPMSGLSRHLHSLRLSLFFLFSLASLLFFLSTASSLSSSLPFSLSYSALTQNKRAHCLF